MRTPDIYRFTAITKGGEEVTMYITSIRLGNLAIKAAQEYGYTNVQVVQTKLLNSVHSHEETLMHELKTKGGEL